MKTLRHILALLVDVLLVVGGAWLAFAALTGITWQRVLDVADGNRWIVAVIGLVAALVGVLLLIGEKWREGRNRFLSFKNDGGTVDISTEAISEYLQKLESAFPSIVGMKTQVAPVGKRLNIIVNVRIKAGPQLHEICEVLQKRVRASMEDGLGIKDVKDIVVRVKEISSEHRTS